MNIITVLKCGGEYTEAHVAWLVKQLPGHEVYCITDSLLDQNKFKQTTGATKLVMRYNAWGRRGWWAKMELFRPELSVIGDFLYIDLDTVILKPLYFQFGEKPCVLSDFYFPTSSIGSGLMWLPENCRDVVWQGWISNPQGHMDNNHGDQDFLTPFFWDADRFQEKFPFQVVSYKAHLSPEDGKQFYKSGYDDMSKISVVCFHGNPRPWHLKKDWIPDVS